MIERILIAGSGGQGVILIGRLLATMAIRNVSHITFFPSYGAEVRGGTSACQVMLSTREIASPLAEQFDVMIAMSQTSCDLFLNQLPKDNLLFINTSLCTIPKGYRNVQGLDATRAADGLGDTRAANFIMLGAYLAAHPILSRQQAETGIRKMLASKDPAITELNLKAFRLGLES